jgi:hypothetical protein
MRALVTGAQYDARPPVEFGAMIEIERNLPPSWR